jgi:hypothetical protein
MAGAEYLLFLSGVLAEHMRFTSKRAKEKINDTAHMRNI